MKTRARIITAVIALALAAMTFVGCGASVDYLYYTDDENYYYDVRVSIPDELEEKIDASSTVQWGQGPDSKMTMRIYLAMFASAFGYDMSFVGYENDCAEYRFLRVVPFEDMEDDGDDEEEDSTKVEIDNLFYMYRVSVTMPHPLNGLKKEFDSPELDTSLMGVLKNGFGALPPLLEAFPAIREEDLEKLECSFLMMAIDGGSSSGETVEKEIRLPGDDETYKVDFYKFTRYFDDEELYITYSYYRPNSTGWYVTIIVIAALAVTLILVFTRKKKDNRPTAEDIFPYNPEDKSAGSDSSLPTGYNGGNSDGGFRY